MTDDALRVMVDAFVDDVSAALAAASSGTPTGDAVTADVLRRDVLNEAYSLVTAFLDVDGRCTDGELWALTGAFGDLLPDLGLAGLTPAEVRASTLVHGRSPWLEQVSTLFDILVTADRRDGTRRTEAYYRRAMDLAHLLAGIDTIPTQDELRAIGRYRTLLLDHLQAHGNSAPRPPIVPESSLPHVTLTLDTPPATVVPTDGQSGSGRDRTGPTGAGAPSSAGAASQEAPEPPGAPEATEPPEPIEELLAELDALVGLDAVKAEVRLVSDLLRVAQLRRERDLPVLDVSLHLVFVGNPGTGKTTVARLLARIYRSVGALESGQLVEVDRSQLVAGFVGQTAPLVTKAFDRADGGMLFVDEAYTLVRGGENDFGREAIDQMVKLLEDRRERTAVVVAGYPDEMAAFVDANPGLRSRFPKTIEFPDYTTDELLAIWDGISEREAYHVDDDARAALRDRLDAEPRTKGFGNGRFVRNLFEAAVARQASRVVRIDEPTDEDLTALTAVDVTGVAP